MNEAKMRMALQWDFRGFGVVLFWGHVCACPMHAKNRPGYPHQRTPRAGLSCAHVACSRQLSRDPILLHSGMGLSSLFLKRATVIPIAAAGERGATHRLIKLRAQRSASWAREALTAVPPCSGSGEAQSCPGTVGGSLPHESSQATVLARNLTFFMLVGTPVTVPFPDGSS